MQAEHETKLEHAEQPVVQSAHEDEESWNVEAGQLDMQVLWYNRLSELQVRQLLISPPLQVIQVGLQDKHVAPER